MNFYTLDKKGVFTYAPVNDIRHGQPRSAGSSPCKACTRKSYRTFRSTITKVMRKSKIIEIYHDSANSRWRRHVYPHRDGVAVYNEKVSPKRSQRKTRALAVQKECEKQLALYQNKINMLQLATLRSSMDNHFIFSVLSAIQHYIIENDKSGALHYLSSFSKLIRGVLNSTRSEQTSLLNEIELIRQYVALEQMRFNNHFVFTLSISDEIDPAIMIPPMLIQPFIENAIVHGLVNNTKRGLLSLDIKMHNTRLMIQIEDDGIGRLAAAELRSIKAIQHQSASTMITEERMKLMKGVTFQIIDKIDHNEAKGTLVVLEVNLDKST